MDRIQDDHAAGVIGWWVVVIMVVLVCRSWAAGLDHHTQPTPRDRQAMAPAPQVESHVSTEAGEAWLSRLAD